MIYKFSLSLDRLREVLKGEAKNIRIGSARSTEDIFYSAYVERNDGEIKQSKWKDGSTVIHCRFVEAAAQCLNPRDADPETRRHIKQIQALSTAEIDKLTID